MTEQSREGHGAPVPGQGGAAPGSELKQAGREAREAARQTAREVKHEATEAVRTVRDEAREKVEEKKEVASGKAHALARALREAGTTLERDGEADMAHYGREAADQVERFAGYLERRDFNGLIRDLEGNARANPGTFVGTTFAAGLLFGRFLRSSAPPRDEGFDGNAGGQDYRTAADAPPSQAGSRSDFQRDEPGDRAPGAERVRIERVPDDSDLERGGAR